MRLLFSFQLELHLSLSLVGLLVDSTESFSDVGPAFRPEVYTCLYAESTRFTFRVPPGTSYPGRDTRRAASCSEGYDVGQRQDGHPTTILEPNGGA